MIDSDDASYVISSTKIECNATSGYTGGVTWSRNARNLLRAAQDGFENKCRTYLGRRLMQCNFKTHRRCDLKCQCKKSFVKHRGFQEEIRQTISLNPWHGSEKRRLRVQSWLGKADFHQTTGSLSSSKPKLTKSLIILPLAKLGAAWRAEVAFAW